MIVKWRSIRNVEHFRTKKEKLRLSTELGRDVSSNIGRYIVSFGTVDLRVNAEFWDYLAARRFIPLFLYLKWKSRNPLRLCQTANPCRKAYK